MRAIGALTAGLIALGAAGSPPQAADSTGRYAGYFTSSCGTFLDARKNNRSIMFDTWLSGYITAVNQHTPETYNYLASTDLLGAMAWMEKYCRENPLSDFSTGASALLNELHPKRQVKAP